MSAAAYDEIALEEEFARASLSRATLRRVASYLAPHKRKLFTGIALELVWVASMLVDPWLVSRFVDGPLASGDAAEGFTLGGWMLANLIFRAALTAFELTLVVQLGTLALHDIRREVFAHIQRLSMRYFDRTKQGRIISRADRDVDTLEHLIIWGPLVAASLFFMLVLALYRIASGYPQLALWIVFTLPVVAVTTRVFKELGFPAYRRVRETHSAISSHVAETITGVRVVKAFSAESRELSKLGRLQQAYRAAVLSGARIAGAYMPSLSITWNAAMLVVLVIGGQAVLTGEISPGRLLEFLLLLGFILGPIEGLGSLYNESLVAGAAAERIFLLLDTTPEVADRPDAVDPGRLAGHVRFDDVSFAYDPDAADGYQLRDVEFEAPAGSTVALVGHTGAGKSSIVNLISRFYEAQEGVVSIDGHDVRDLRLDVLHAQLGMVLQENFLFAGSVLDNLRFVRPELTEEEARRGFSELACERVLDQLPDGLETDVGERGANLSEGERQVVCFVRALLARPAVLILDEATSAVDTRTESLLFEALRRLSSRQTTFIVAHRLSTIRHADQILVMEEGRIVERGTHHDLLRKPDGVYAALYAEYAR